MRTIKFRGRRLGGWYYGDLECSRCTERTIIHSYRDDGRYGGTIRVERDTVGQFTGLKDKDGKEIYEGDIFRAAAIKGVITWHPSGYFCIHTAKKNVAECSYRPLGEVIKYLIREGIDFVVIGNIHDNPELLKGGNQ